MLKEFLIPEDIVIKEAMRRMNRTGEKTLFITDEGDRLRGSLTDGDIRRWILKDGELTDEVKKVYNRTPVFVAGDYDLEEVKKLMLDNRIEWIPVVDDKRRVIEVLCWDDVFGKDSRTPRGKLDIPVVIMAGGEGTRLDPFTRILPKPLIPIGEKAIIDIIMEKFSHYGINEFYVSINHKAKMIKSYFEEINPARVIRYIEEEQPLGTAGSLRFLRGQIQGSLLVSNCDIIVDCDYCEVVDFHDRNDHDITIIGSFRHFTIPYGICEIEKGGVLTGMTEKPEYDFLVNTGMSVLRKSALELIPENQKFHITELINSVRERGGKVGVFPISEKSWIDVGQWEEYRKSVKLLGIEQ